jgi:glucose-1-phosphate cytidylyltransferase
MKVVLFAGGLGTRISEESHLKPKPMIEIGGKPILWHIMKSYAAYGHNEFIICCGYKGHIIKEYFTNYFNLNADITVDTRNNKITLHETHKEDFTVTMIDTGLDTMTAGRLQRVLPYTNGEPFLLTYGDGVADIDINETIAFHQQHGKIVTMSTIQPTSRFGVVVMDEKGQVEQFEEKPADSGTWINGGFFVINPEVKSYLHEGADTMMWERQPLYDLAKDGQLVGFKHRGFWKCMDTLRDKEELETLWNNNAPWKKW